MSSRDPVSASASGLELLLERLGSGLGAERVLLEPAATVTAQLGDARVLHAAMTLADGSPGVLSAERSAASPAFDTTERRLFEQLAAIAETVLTLAGDATRRSRTLAITHAIATTVDGLSTVAERLAAAVDAVFEHSGYHPL